VRRKKSPNWGTVNSFSPCPKAIHESPVDQSGACRRNCLSPAPEFRRYLARPVGAVSEFGHRGEIAKIGLCALSHSNAKKVLVELELNPRFFFLHVPQRDVFTFGNVPDVFPYS